MLKVFRLMIAASVLVNTSYVHASENSDPNTLTCPNHPGMVREIAHRDKNGDKYAELRDALYKWQNDPKSRTKTKAQMCAWLAEKYNGLTEAKAPCTEPKCLGIQDDDQHFDPQFRQAMRNYPKRHRRAPPEPDDEPAPGGGANFLNNPMVGGLIGGGLGAFIGAMLANRMNQQNQQPNYFPPPQFPPSLLGAMPGMGRFPERLVHSRCSVFCPILEASTTVVRINLVLINRPLHGPCPILAL